MARARTTQEKLDAEALIIASSVDGRQNRHEEECVRRYAALDSSLHNLETLLWRVACAIIVILLGGFTSTLWYVITHR